MFDMFLYFFLKLNHIVFILRIKMIFKMNQIIHNNPHN